jgi:FlaA1/EpsC-like NDP-sugar epimerase
MMHRPLRVLSAIVLLCDLATVSVAYVLAYLLRFQFEVVPITKGFAPFGVYLSFLPVALLLWTLASSANGLYAPQRKHSFIDESLAVAKSGSLATLFLLALTFFYRDYSFSRVMLLLFWGTSIFLAALGRVVVILTVRWRHRHGHNVSAALIVGAGSLGQAVAQKIAGMPQLGLRVAGFVDDTAPAAATPPDGVRVLGRIAALPDLVRAHHAAQVFFALPARRTRASSAVWDCSSRRWSTSSSSPTSCSS